MQGESVELGTWGLQDWPSAGHKAQACLQLWEQKGCVWVHGNSSGPLCVLIRDLNLNSNPTGGVPTFWNHSHPFLLGSLFPQTRLLIGSWEESERWSLVPGAPADTGEEKELSGLPEENKAPLPGLPTLSATEMGHSYLPWAATQITELRCTCPA